MRRPGRYTLAVMAWIAVYAGWSSVLGLVIAAITGERLDDGDQVGPTVGLGVSTLFTVVLPLVPTLVALWFSDWLRDGAPSRAERKRAARRPEIASAPRAPEAEAVEATVADPPAARPARAAPASRESGTGDLTATPQRSGELVAAAPLGVPELADSPVGKTGYPVAPVLRASDEAPPARLAAPAAYVATSAPGAPSGVDAGRGTTAPTAPAEPRIDPNDPLGVGDLRLPRVDRGDEALGV